MWNELFFFSFLSFFLYKSAVEDWLGLSVMVVYFPWFMYNRLALLASEN